MNEIQVLSNDINVITVEIKTYQRMGGEAIYEIGRRLKEVRDNPGKYGFKSYRDWENWCLNVCDISRRSANRFIQAFEELGTTSSRLSSGKVFEIIQFPENINKKDFVESEHYIPSTGETKTVDEMTVKELREVKMELKKAKEEKSTLEKRLLEEQSKPPKVETKVIEKEVDKTDYKTIERLNKLLKQKEHSYILLENEKNAIEEKMDLLEEQNEEYQNLKTRIQYLAKEKDDLSRQIESATSISALVVEIEHLINEKLAPVKYSRALQEMRDDEIVVKNLSEIIYTVQTWCDEMNSYLPNKRKIIDMEVM